MVNSFPPFEGDLSVRESVDPTTLNVSCAGMCNVSKDTIDNRGGGSS